jgi:23S rRNA (guanosine2251-2'-O)-methyltransferase
MQPVREAIRAHGAKLDRVLVETNPAEGPQLDALARFATDHGVKVERVGRGDLDRLTKGARHQGALAWAPELAVLELDALLEGDRALLVALDELQDPQNFGAIVRSAVALGATGVVWPEHRSAPLSPAMFRASAGAVEHATLCRVSALPSALATMRASGLTVVGLDMNGDRTLSAVDLTGPIALVVGAEGKGLRKTVKSACDVVAKLPMRGNLASLNASVAAAIGLYEVARQRDAQAQG